MVGIWSACDEITANGGLFSAALLMWGLFKTLPLHPASTSWESGFLSLISAFFFLNDSEMGQFPGLSPDRMLSMNTHSIIWIRRSTGACL